MTDRCLYCDIVLSADRPQSPQQLMVAMDALPPHEQRLVQSIEIDATGCMTMMLARPRDKTADRIAWFLSERLLSLYGRAPRVVVHGKDGIAEVKD